jgi:hypothetical protein
MDAALSLLACLDPYDWQRQVATQGLTEKLLHGEVTEEVPAKRASADRCSPASIYDSSL